MAKGKPEKTPINPELEQQIVDALKKDDVAALARLISTGIDLNSRIKSANNLPLLYACRHHDAFECAKHLIKAGADMAKGQVDVFWAVYVNRPDLVKLMLEHGADVNFHNRYMGRPLGFAARKNMTEMVRLLIDSGADLDADPPLGGAIREGSMQAAQMVLDAGCKIPVNEGLLAYCIYKKHKQFIKPLVDRGANLNEKSKIEYYDSKKMDQVKFCADSTPLVVAARIGDVESVDLLLDNGADYSIPDVDGMTALQWAEKNGHKKIADLIHKAARSRPAQTNPSQDLLFAAEKGEIDQVIKLLDAGADIDIRDQRDRSKGYTPLMLAALNGHVKVVKNLLDAGAGIDLKDDTEPDNSSGFGFIYNEGGAEMCRQAGFQLHRTPLLLACENGHVEVVKLLLRKGTAFNQIDRTKSSPLHLACEKASKEIVALLIASGADVNLRDKSKSTPLHLAAESGDLEIIDALLAAGAKVDLKNSDSHTPLARAAWKAHPMIVDRLIQAGAESRSILLCAVNHHLVDQHYEKNKIVAVFQRPVENVIRIIQSLLRAGDDPNLPDKHGESSIEHAQRLVKQTRDAQPILDALLSAPGAKIEIKASKPQPAKPTASPRPIKRKHAPAMKRPRLLKASKEKSFQSILKDLSELTGDKPQSFGALEGCFYFNIHSDKSIDLEKMQAIFLKQGAFIFSTDKDEINEIVVLPSTQKYDALLLWDTNGANDDITTEDIVQWFTEIEKDYPLILTAVGCDFVAGRFIGKLKAKDARKLAERMFEICPDITDSNPSLLDDFAEDLQREGKFHFWWD